MRLARRCLRHSGPSAAPPAAQFRDDESCRALWTLSTSFLWKAPKLPPSIFRAGSLCSDKERERGDHEVWNCEGNAVGVLEADVGMSVKFVYDHVFDGFTPNQKVYSTVASSIVQSAMDGINGTIFAYGVTSSGKTHTMMGDDNTPGIVPHAIAEVYTLVAKFAKKEFLLRLSMLEIYNEVVNDLLDPANTNLRLRQDPRRGVYVEGIKEERLMSAEHALLVVATGNEHRKISATAFNEGSSRSHTVIRLTIEASDRPEYSGDRDAHVSRTLSYLTMVDLAGSESAKAEVNHNQRVEGSFINKSLLTLSTVIHKLSEGGAAHIPFRDSKLTRLLSNSLTGNAARMAVICTITPAATQAEETHNTLKFASRAKKVPAGGASQRAWRCNNSAPLYARRASLCFSLVTVSFVLLYHPADHPGGQAQRDHGPVLAHSPLPAGNLAAAPSAGHRHA